MADLVNCYLIKTLPNLTLPDHVKNILGPLKLTCYTSGNVDISQNADDDGTYFLDGFQPRLGRVCVVGEDIAL